MPTAEQIATIVNQKAAEMSGRLAPSVLYTSIAYTVLLPVLFNKIKGTPLPKSPIPVAGFLLGVFAFIVGTQQLTDESSHRPNATKIKGLVNVLLGLESIAIPCASLINPSLAALGPIGFAASMAVIFGMSLDDTVHAARKLDPQFWIKDAYAQLDKLDKQIASQPNSESTKQLNAQREQLKSELLIQIKALLIKNEHVKIDGYKNEIKIEDIKSEVKELSSNAKNTILMKQYKIQETCENAFGNCVSNSLISGLALSGAVLLCVPGLQIPGLALLAAATLIFTATSLHSAMANKPIKHGIADIKRNGQPPSAAPGKSNLMTRETTRNLT